MHVESVFFSEVDNKFVKRKFIFGLDEGLIEQPIEDTDAIMSCTSVHLERYITRLSKNSSIEIVSEKILEHCLSYFIDSTPPNFFIHDDNVTISLNKLFDDSINIDEIVDDFDIGEKKFRINYAKNYLSGNGSHKIHYMADGREVDTESINKLIPSLSRKLSDDEKPYYISAYVKSDYLNEHINPHTRTEFTIPKKEKDKDIYSPISFEEINREIAEKIKYRHQNTITDIQNDTFSEIARYIRTDAQEYLYLLDYPELIGTIKQGITDSEKNLSLHRLNYEVEQKQKDSLQKFLAQRPERIQNIQEYKESLDELLKSVDDTGKGKLINYMIHRKAVLSLLEKFIEIQADGKFKLEANIHDVIFRRKKTNRELNFNEHNLWILDERMAYHEYIASDKAFRDIEHIKNDSQDAADLLIFDTKFVYGEPKDLVVVCEFKRPMRDTYSLDEKRDISAQVMRYIDDLVEGKKNNDKDFKGRYHKISETTPKFAYIICDMDKEMEDALRRKSFKESPKRTFFKYEEGVNTFIEVLNYDQLLEDAKLRHKAFFNQLGI
jgi:hypothetical protein